MLDEQSVLKLQKIVIADAHDALGDCLMTLEVIRAMAKES